MLNKIRYAIQRFMYGRNGLDDLNRALIFVALGVAIINIFVKSNVLNIIYYVIVLLVLFRYLSRNISARARENAIAKNLYKLIKAQITQGRDYKIFMCKGCGRIIRVPRHHGKIEVTCPQCGAKKVMNT